MSNNTSYQQMAQVYDRLMERAPYNEWVDFAKRMWGRKGLTPSSIVDLACGTGAIAVRLAKAGFQVIGVDLSEDMLAVAYDKAKENRVNLSLLHQDMRSFEVPCPVDVVLCFCDSLNYLTEPQDIQQAFQQVNMALNPGGLFLFDVHSLYKINEVFGNHSFVSNEDEISYIWQCELEEENLVIHELTIFVKEGSLYKRFDEVHVQRGYKQRDLVAWLRSAGFTDIHVSADFGQSEPHGESERLFFSAQKAYE